jgi:molybdopterin converting factor small subunit
VQIEVRLFANLREKLPGARRGRASLEIAEGTTVWELVAALEIPERQAQMVLVNGERVARPGTGGEPPVLREGDAAIKVGDAGIRVGEAVLKDGDTVCVFPPLAGG